MTWAVWGEDHLVYHHRSGKTHLLNQGSALLLREVLAVARDPVGAALELARLQGAVPDDRLSEHVRQLLARFDDVGLVGRVDS